MSYMTFLTNLNNEKKSDDESNKCSICPISQSEINAKDISSTISVISNTSVVSEVNIAKLITQGFVIVQSTNPILCHHVDTFDLNDAKKWFIDVRGVHPMTRRVLTDDERDRIEFRFATQEFQRLNVSDYDITILFTKYLSHLMTGEQDTTTDDFTILRCHMSPEKLPNYFYMTREQAEDKINSAIDSQNPFLWIARPSAFKGYEFAMDANGIYYPMVEYTVISVIDNDQKFSHNLIEKIYSKGFYNGFGSYVRAGSSKTLNLERGDSYPCFFDSLHVILKCLVIKGIDVTKCIPLAPL